MRCDRCIANVFLCVREKAWPTEAEFYWSSPQNWLTNRSIDMMTSPLMTCWSSRWQNSKDKESRHPTNAIIRHYVNIFLSWPTEVSQEEEVFPICGLLFGHTAAGCGRCHPVWGQHRQLWQQVRLHLPPPDVHHPVQQSSVWWWVLCRQIRLRSW